MKKRSKKIVWIFILMAFIFIAAIVIFFKLPYSRTASEFRDAVDKKISNTAKYSDTFTEEDLKDLPLPVQKYFKYCGYLGTPKMSYMKASFRRSSGNPLHFNGVDESWVSVLRMKLHFFPNTP